MPPLHGILAPLHRSSIISTLLKPMLILTPSHPPTTILSPPQSTTFFPPNSTLSSLTCEVPLHLPHSTVITPLVVSPSHSILSTPCLILSPPCPQPSVNSATCPVALLPPPSFPLLCPPHPPQLYHHFLLLNFPSVHPATLHPVGANLISSMLMPSYNHVPQCMTHQPHQFPHTGVRVPGFQWEHAGYIAGIETLCPAFAQQEHPVHIWSVILVCAPNVPIGSISSIASMRPCHVSEMYPQRTFQIVCICSQNVPSTCPGGQIADTSIHLNNMNVHKN